MKKYYSFAGLDICIEGSEQYLKDTFDDKLLQEYEVVSTYYRYFYDIKVVDKLTYPCGQSIVSQNDFCEFMINNSIIRYVGTSQKDWKNAYLRIECNQEQYDIQVLKSSILSDIGLHVLYRMLDTERIVCNHNGILLHASFIEFNGEAILFTAPSGIGKSTQANLWVKYRGAKIINGDRCALRFIDDRLYACGVPFAGSSNISINKTLPLKCIVCLGQSPINTINRLSGYKAFRYLWEGVGVNTWDIEHVEKVSSIVEKIINCVPIYKLDCTPDVYAIEKLEECL